MISFGIVGAGWRTEFFLRIARALPDRFTVTGVVARSAEKGEAFTRTWGVPTFRTLDDLRAAEPHLPFIVASVPWEVSPPLLTECAEKGLPVLAETPPAPDIARLTALSALSGARIQVAEQYAFQPLHAARIAVAHSGRIGRVTQAQVSAAHGYHGTSLIRRYLGIDFENVTVTATRFVTPLVQSPGRSGPPAEERIVDSGQVIAQLRFEDGRFGIFDFTGDQYFSYVRGPRVLVRGERGEIEQETVRWLLDPATGMTAPLTRVDTGQGGNLEGYYHRGYTLSGEWVYRNPVAPGRLADDEIAIATLLEGMSTYANGGPDIYSLADAAQDRYLDLLIEESLRTGAPATSSSQPWARE